MTIRRTILAGSALVLACGVLPASADAYWRGGHGWHWRATHHAIYELENRIVYLQADPEMDDGYKGPIITGARAEILQLRVTLPPARRRWSGPCCYSRKPLHIR